jgi:murein DD-endopeptidase MepM/ murein hydrolase activator NlpD
MRWAAVIVAAALIWAWPARGDDLRLDWPLRPHPAVVRSFDAPAPDWNRGHRGVDLAGRPGQPVYAAGAGTVVYAGMLAGRQVVSLAHPGGLHTSYEPIQATVRVGQLLTAGTVIGELLCQSAGFAGVHAHPAQAVARLTISLAECGVDVRISRKCVT